MRLFAKVLLFGAAMVLAACSSTGEAGPAGPAGAAGAAGPVGPAGAAAAIDIADLTCTGCHESTGFIVSKAAQVHESLHGSGEAYVRGTSAGCAGCHGSEGASARISAGLAPHDASIVGIPNVSPMNCRTCHEIHTTYTTADFALRGGEAAVAFEMTEGTYDRGAGNLCANCHQIRNELPVAAGGTIEVTSSRFGTHHGVESQMMVGVGALGVAGNESPHYSLIEDGCPSCHMATPGAGEERLGEEWNHTFEPNLANCQGCHADLDTFDRNGVQTEISALMEEVKALLVEAGIMDLEVGDNRSAVGVFPEEVVNAMWNYMFILEDGSHGVHNPAFAKAMLEAAKVALGG